MKGMIVVRVDRCLGCKSCELACAVEHSESKELLKALNEKPKPRKRVSVEQGDGFVVPLQCRHCEDAPCIGICPTKALHRADKDSPVVIDEDLCIGCKWCILACPFGVITLDDENRVITKCDQCFQRVERGETPACVASCPTGALDFKSLAEVLKEKRQATLLEIDRGTAKPDS
jgi:carbon-monoxide dehydrogenase iron sulfur subunit